MENLNVTIDSPVATETKLELASETPVQVFGFTNVDPRSESELTDIFTSCECSVPGIKMAIDSIIQQTFLENITITELTSDKGVAPYLPLLSGKISVRVLQNQAIPKTVTFNDNPQKIFLITGKVETLLEKPDEFGCLFGPRQGMFLLFPEMIHEDEEIQYPIFRLTPEKQYNWDAEDPKVMRLNVFFQGATGIEMTREDGTKNNIIKDRLPSKCYRAARVLGIPEEMLDVRVVDMVQREAASASKKLKNAARTAPTSFAALPSENQGFRVGQNVQLP